MSTKNIQHWLNNTTALRDRGPLFRVFATLMFLFHLLAMICMGVLLMLQSSGR